MEPFLFSIAISTHIGLTDTYNEIHPHVRLYEDGAIAGAYYNSMDRISLYAGHRSDVTDNIGVEFALVTGYPAFGPVAPYVRGTVDVGKYGRFFAAPAYEKTANDELTVGLVLGMEFTFQ